MLRTSEIGPKMSGQTPRLSPCLRHLILRMAATVGLSVTQAWEHRLDPLGMAQINV